MAVARGTPKWNSSGSYSGLVNPYGRDRELMLDAERRQLEFCLEKARLPTQHPECRNLHVPGGATHLWETQAQAGYHTPDTGQSACRPM